jgi:hypothetical protein
MHEYLKERDLWWPVSPELMASYNDGSHTEKRASGSLGWFINGIRHRDSDKPAEIWATGLLVWYKNGYWHRDGDKPAYIDADGTLEWYKNGERHRTTGPAVIYPNNKYEYWVNDIEITSEVKSWLKTRKYTYPFTPEQQVEFTLTFS